MKKIAIILLVLLPLLSFGQKIKIKKGIILFDGKEVAKLDNKTRDNYKFSTLKGEKSFDVVFKGLSASNLEGFQWLELTSANGVKTEIPYEVLMTSFSVSKLVIKLLSTKYELLNSNGIQQDKVDAFFSVERESLSDKHLKAVVSAKADQAERQQRIGQYNPFVQDNGTVVFGGARGTNIVGKAYKSGTTYTITDLDRMTVATAKGCSTCTKVEVTTYTDEIFEYDYGSKTMMTGQFSRSFANLLVEELVGRGYHLGHEAKDYKAELHKEKVNIAKENSTNLYGVSGYVIDKDGKKYEGIIYAVFEKLQLNPDEQEQELYEMDAIDKYGKNVSVKYTNEKGRKRIKKFTAKSGATFCANNQGEEKCFYGMKTKGNALKKLSNASNFGFDNSYFYQLVNKTGNHMLLSKPGEEDTYILKFSDKKEGFMVDKRKSDKLSDALAKFISNCKSLASDFKNKEFDLTENENLKQILEEYNNCQK